MNIKYMIHTCPNRLWYVEEFMIPSMLKQGIKQEEIYVYNDDLEDGNFLAFLKAFRLCYEQNKNDYVWHLDDDVILCEDFRIRAELMIEQMKANNIIASAGITVLDNNAEISGEVVPNNFWFSFPCICINSRIFLSYSRWLKEKIETSKYVQDAVRTKKNNDGVFMLFLRQIYPFAKCYNIKPNLIDHVDWLIGGSEVNKERKKIYRAKYFEDQWLIDELKEQLNSRWDTL